MGDLAMAIGGGVGVLVACLFGFFVLPKIKKKLIEKKIIT